MNTLLKVTANTIKSTESLKASLRGTEKKISELQEYIHELECTKEKYLKVIQNLSNKIDACNKVQEDPDTLMQHREEAGKKSSNISSLVDELKNQSIEMGQ